MADTKKILNGFKKAGAASLDPLCKLIASLGFLMIVLEVGYTCLRGINIGISLFVPVMAAGYYAGFILQGLILAISKKRRENDYTWEGNTKYFNFAAAVPALAAAFIAAVLSKNFFYMYYEVLVKRGVIQVLDAYSLQPVLCALIFFLSAAAGIVIQFYPYGRIMSFDRVLWHCAISLLCAIMSFGSVYIGIFFAIYAAAAVFVMNQNYITRVYNSVTVTKITPTARLYNMRMILLCLLLTVIGGAVALFALNGLYYLLRFLVYLAIFSIIRWNKPASSRVDDVSQQMNDAVFGEGQMTNQISLLGFILLLIMAIVLVIFARNGAVRAIIDAIKRWFAEFIALFMGSDEPVSAREINYRDTVERVSRPEKTVSVYQGKRRFTKRDFASEISMLKTDEEKLGYSYIVMINLLSELNTSLRPSDTPRELAEKLHATMSIDGIYDITSAIELIKYAERSLNPVSTKKALETVRSIVEKRLV